MKRNSTIIPFILLCLIGFPLVLFSIAQDPKDASASISHSGSSSTSIAAATSQTSSQIAFTKFMHLGAPSLTLKKNRAGIYIITNSSSTIVLVNKKRELASTYRTNRPRQTEYTLFVLGESPKKYMRKPAAAALEKLFAGAKKDSISLKGVSGYPFVCDAKSNFQSQRRS